MFDIAALGEILIDFTPYGVAEDGCKLFGRNAGGAPANLLATISKFGGKAAFIGKVGRDMFGDYLIETLKSCNINTDGMSIDDIHNTTLAFVSLNEDGDRDFSFYRRFGADVFLAKEDINKDIIKQSKIFHFGSLSLTDEPAKTATDYALSIAKNTGCTITFDPNYRPLLWKSKESAVKTMQEYVKYANILKVSEEEAQMITGKKNLNDCCEQLIKFGPQIVLITLGADGAMIAAENYIKTIPAFKANTIDTTGAGDIFFGTFLFELIKNDFDINTIDINLLEKAVCKAVHAASISTEIKGAIPAIPDYSKI